MQMLRAWVESSGNVGEHAARVLHIKSLHTKRGIGARLLGFFWLDVPFRAAPGQSHVAVRSHAAVRHARLTVHWFGPADAVLPWASLQLPEHFHAVAAGSPGAALQRHGCSLVPVRERELQYLLPGRKVVRFGGFPAQHLDFYYVTKAHSGE